MTGQSSVGCLCVHETSQMSAFLRTRPIASLENEDVHSILIINVSNEGLCLITENFEISSLMHAYGQPNQWTRGIVRKYTHTITEPPLTCHYAPTLSTHCGLNTPFGRWCTRRFASFGKRQNHDSSNYTTHL